MSLETGTPKILAVWKLIIPELRVLALTKIHVGSANEIGSAPGGEGGTPLFGLYGDVSLDRVWFFGLAVLNRVYNLSCLCPTQGQNLS